MYTCAIWCHFVLFYAIWYYLVLFGAIWCYLALLPSWRDPFGAHWAALGQVLARDRFDALGNGSKLSGVVNNSNEQLF